MREKEKYKTDAALPKECDCRIGAARIRAQQVPHAPARITRAAADARCIGESMNGVEKIRPISNLKSQVSSCGFQIFYFPVRTAAGNEMAGTQLRHLRSRWMPSPPMVR